MIKKFQYNKIFNSLHVIESVNYHEENMKIKPVFQKRENFVFQPKVNNNDKKLISKSISIRIKNWEWRENKKNLVWAYKWMELRIK